MSTATAGTGRPEAAPAGGVYADALLHLAALSVVAGAIHAVVAPSHLAEAWTHGALLAMLAAFQLGWAVRIYARPSPGGFRAGIAVSLAAIGLWVASRTIGVPFGPGAWQAEPVGVVDLAATASEAMIAMIAPAFLAGGGAAPTDAVLPLAARYLRPLIHAELVLGLLALLLGAGHHAH
jgi:hypothetical protein